MQEFFQNLEIHFCNNQGLVGVPEALINAISRTNDKQLEIISNEGGVHNHGLDVLFKTKQVIMIDISIKITIAKWCQIN